MKVKNCSPFTFTEQYYLLSLEFCQVFQKVTLLPQELSLCRQSFPSDGYRDNIHVSISVQCFTLKLLDDDIFVLKCLEILFTWLSTNSQASVAQAEEQSPINRKVGGSTPGFPGPHAEESLGKTLNPVLPRNAAIGVWMCMNAQKKASI